MSAYKDLEALLGGTPLARKVIDAALAEHAHELAEKVMALRANVPDYAASAAWKRGYEAALTMAVLEIENPQKEGQ
ncbi:hypothetical protein [Streptomyces sp. enrichment culture]|uniref:hypothetical protein n=1 Tax=Streptomyces sp. enrichment culture TaxID=1795815 RepID=UPI003F5557F1